MSCMMCSPRHIAAVSDGLARLLNGSLGCVQLAPAPELFEALDDCHDSCFSFDARRIFDRLQTLNAAAYDSRYEEAPSPVYSMPETFPRFLHRMPFEKGRYILGPDFFGFVKALDSLIYQCEEDANRAEPLLDALQNTSAALYAFAVRQSADYAAADWIL